MKDYLIKATVPGVRAFCTVTTASVAEAVTRHDCYPIAAAALGRTMTASLLLAANLKTDECITIRICGNGPLGEVVADAGANGIVRGTVRNPHIDLPLKNGKLDVGGAIGIGLISVTRFTGMKQPFTGSSHLVTGEIAEDLTNYLACSEQTPSSVGLGVLVDPDLSVSAAGGFFIQALPECEEEVLAKVEENLATLPPVSQMIKEGITPEQMAERIFAGLPVIIYDPMKVEFGCQCSKERIEEVLVSIGEEEIDSLIAEGKAEVCCHFCTEKYQFDKAELEAIKNTIQRSKKEMTEE
ncbi:MAG: Hsp33 family molecular chaperone HslO [Selenomonadales bacterium]|nr:Hsp33 family molecular chaperone HslO [Selenomonadales bacterium]